MDPIPASVRLASLAVPFYPGIQPYSRHRAEQPGIWRREMQETPPQVRLHTAGFEPRPCGWFTTDSEGEYRGEDPSLLRYLYLPPGELELDLNARHELDDYSLPYYVTENMDPLLHWIMDHPQRDADGKALRPMANFVCLHELLIELLKIPFHGRYAMEVRVCAIRLDGVIYMSEFSTPLRLEYETKAWENKNKRRRNGMQGKKFQQYLLSDSPGVEADASGPLITTKRTQQVVMRASLSSHGLLYSSVHKGCRGEEDMQDLGTARFFDLRTTEDDNYSGYQLLEWWTTALVNRNEETIVGLRGDGVMRKLDTLSVPQILSKMQTAMEQQNDANRSRAARPQNQSWRSSAPRGGSSSGAAPPASHSWRGPRTSTGAPTPPVAPQEPALDVRGASLGFLRDFLDHVVQVVDEEGPEVAFVLDWSLQKSGVFRCRKLRGEASVLYRFLPAWYVDWVRQSKTD